MRYFAIFILAVSAAFTLSAQDQQAYIELKGTAEEEYDAQYLNMVLTVAAEGKDAEALQKEIRGKSEEVLAFLRENPSVSKINTHRLQLRPDYRNGQEDPKLSVQQDISMRLVDLEAYDEFIFSLVQRGVTRYRSASFGREGMEELQKQLLAQALENARSRAQLLAQQDDRKLGPVLRIEEPGGGSNPRFDASIQKLSSSSTISDASFTLSEVLVVRFALE